MAIELSPEEKAQAVASLERYVLEHLDLKIGNVAAGGLLSYILTEIGPSIYNQAVADVQDRLRQRVDEVDIEVHEEPFAYWPRPSRRGRA